MPVVSISLNDTLLEKLEQIKEEMGFSGRSEIIRTAVRDFINEKRKIDDLSGDISAVLTVIHADEDLKTISEIQHENQEIIQTQIHDHIDHSKCLQTYILNGDAIKVRELYQNFQSSKEIKETYLQTL